MFDFHLSLNFNKILIHVHYLKYIPLSSARMLSCLRVCFSALLGAVLGYLPQILLC